MTCPEVRLEEYLDGELDAPAREGVEAHLAACAGCRGELAGLHRLEDVLRAAPAGNAPDADRFVARVRARSRQGGWSWIAAAAAVLISMAVLFVHSPPVAVDVRAELAKYASAPSAELEGRIRDAGRPGLAILEKALEGGEVKVQFAAATLLFKLADEPTRNRVLARFQQRPHANGGWTLSEPGTDEDDVEMVPVAVSALEGAGQERWALDVLRKLNRFNLKAQAKIIESVVVLLKSDQPKVQKLALEIVKELEIEFPLSAIVDLLDSPELGPAALDVLRKGTGKDFGRDKAKWYASLER